MKKVTFLFLILVTSVFSMAAQAGGGSAAGRVAPNLSVTPGVLCSSSDPNYSGLDYPEKIARCARNIPNTEKLDVAVAYGNIPQAEWPNYEFDHLLPLCAGGSDDERNLWPQPIAQAHEKDKLEVEICTAMKAGTMTQAIAVQKVYDWFSGASTAIPPSQPSRPSRPTVPGPNGNPQNVTCTSTQNPTLVARFQVIDDNDMAGISLALNDNGDHELISASGPTSGTASLAKRRPLMGLTKFAITNAGGKDRFELFLPSSLATARQESFIAYVKISFEGTFPNLAELSCAFDAVP